MILFRAIIVLEGIITYGSKYYGIDIGAGRNIIEWAVFHETFYVFAVLTELMPYTLKVVRKDQWFKYDTNHQTPLFPRHFDFTT